MSTVMQNESSASGRRFTLWHLSLVLLVIGLFVSGYLSYTHLTESNVVCIENATFNCDTVNSSIYASLLGIPVAYLGFASDVFLLVILLLEPRVSFLRSYGVMIFFAVVLLGFIYHGYLTYVSLTRINALCIWCLAHHAIVTVLLIVTGIRLYRVLFSADDAAEA